MIWLPEFSNANSYWDISNDDRDAGWIWVEATGSSNPLGWTPPDFRDGGWTAYAIGDLEFVSKPESPQSTPLDIDITMVIVAAIFFIILTLAKGRRR